MWGSFVYNLTIVTDTILEYIIKDNVVVCASRIANVYVDKIAPSCGSVGYENISTSSCTVTVGCSDNNSWCKSNPCDSCPDYSNCLATVETTCKTWESGWTDVDDCDDVSENRQWRMVYRAR